MAPKRKSTPSRNLLHFRASSSSNPTPSNVQFCDEKAKLDFFENFSRHGVHSDAKSSCRTSSTLTYPLSFTVGVRSHFVASRHLSIHADTRVLLQHAWIWLFRTSVFYSHSRYAHRGHSGILYPRCSMSLGYRILITLVVTIWGLCPKMSSCPLFVTVLLIGVIVSWLRVRSLLKALGFLTWLWPLFFILFLIITLLLSLVLNFCFLS